MDSVVLGRTGLTVGGAGLGCGGHSRLGQAQGASEQQSIDLVRAALDLGITYFDTAHQYGTEDIVGRALEDRRSEAVVSTKVEVRPRGGERIDAPGLRRAIEESLGRLRTVAVDVFHLHAVMADDYQYCLDELVPELLHARSRGDIRYLALSENFGRDFSHEMLQRAVLDDCWDVMMVGVNILNPSARHRVLPFTLAHNIGVEVMFAVRTVLSQPDALRRAIASAAADGLIDAETIDLEDPLGFLIHQGGATSIVEAAYRFCRFEPGCHVVLTGTGNIDHLRANVAAINGAPLPSEDQDRLRSLFGHLAHFAGN